MEASQTSPSNQNQKTEVTFPITTSLCYVIKDREVLLQYKKRGFGAGKWNGPGGKLEPGETIEQAAARELTEETGIVASGVLTPAGDLEFVWEGKPEQNQHCYLFVCKNFTGELQETEEGRPQWFSFDEIPYDEMWEDDIIWFPQLLTGEAVRYRFYFSDTNTLRSYDKLS